MKILIISLFLLLNCTKPVANKIYIPADACQFAIPKNQVKTFEGSYKRQMEVLEVLQSRCECYRQFLNTLNQ